MKRIVFFLLLQCPFWLTAQSTSGEITYRETIQMKIEMPDADEKFKKMIPPSQSVTKVLIFNADAALYKEAGPAGEGDINISNEEDGNTFQFVIQRPKNVLYTDLNKLSTINEREFFGRDFLISGKARECEWKMTGEKKMIGEYECHKAVLQDTSEQIVAWFTPQIPVQIGPSNYGMLPGLILEVDVDNGTRTIMVTKLDLKPVPSIEKPSKGKKVTEEEFKTIEAEKMKEMGAEMGGSGKGIRMIITNDQRN